jgi:hypothetical protein
LHNGPRDAVEDFFLADFFSKHVVVRVRLAAIGRLVASYTQSNINIPKWYAGICFFRRYYLDFKLVARDQHGPLGAAHVELFVVLRPHAAAHAHVRPRRIALWEHKEKECEAHEEKKKKKREVAMLLRTANSPRQHERPTYARAGERGRGRRGLHLLETLAMGELLARHQTYARGARPFRQLSSLVFGRMPGKK